MFLTQGTQGQSAKAIGNQAANMQTGFNVAAQIHPNKYQQVYQRATQLPQDQVSESDSAAMASMASSSTVSAQIYGEYLNNRNKVVQNVANMHQSELRYQQGLSRTSAQLGAAQNQTVESFAQDGYKMGISNAQTAGAVSAYQRGYRLANAAF